MKTMIKFATMMFIVAFASHANAATDIKIEKGANVSVGVNTDGSLKLSAGATPGVAPAKADATKASGKQKLTGKKKKKKSEAELAKEKADREQAEADLKKWEDELKRQQQEEAKKKSLSVKFNFNPLNIFMPDKITTTALSDHLVLMAGLRAFNNTDTSNQPNGFKTVASDATGTSGNYALGLKYWRIGAEYDPSTYVTDLATSYNGASLNMTQGLQISTSNKLLGKFYIMDTRDYGVSLGLGAEYTSLSGGVGMGGFKFETTGEGWTPVMKLGGEYHLNRFWTCWAAYEQSNIRITTKIPGAPDLITTRNGRMMFGLSLGLF